jgi:hypothetical protein
MPWDEYYICCGALMFVGLSFEDLVSPSRTPEDTMVVSMVWPLTLVVYFGFLVRRRLSKGSQR